MEPWQEPVRGAVMPREAWALPGLERIRGYGRRWYPGSPMHHLTGFGVSQVANGSVVCSMPISPWIAGANGTFYDTSILARTAGALAVESTLPPGYQVSNPAVLNMTLLRNLDPDTTTLVGRCSVVRTTPGWVSYAGSVEDGAGRVAAQINGHLMTVPVDFDVPDEAPTFEPIESPTYPSPDPYRRPAPSSLHELRTSTAERGFASTLSDIVEGRLPRPPIHQLLGIRYCTWDGQTLTGEATTSRWFGHYGDLVEGPYLDAFVTATASAASQASAPEGQEPSIVHLTSTHLALVPCDGRVLAMTSRTRRVADDAVETMSEIRDGDLVLGTHTQILVTEPVRSAPAPPTRRILATVLFTDIVGSTEAAEAAGDSKWAQTLERHHAIAQAEVEGHGGRIVKSTGDGVLATFDAPSAAVEAATAIRDGVLAIGVEIRAGVHTGECELAGGDVSGIAVHVASRVESAAGPGEVWVSETTKGLTIGSGLSFSDMGDHELKGLDEPMRLYRVEGP